MGSSELPPHSALELARTLSRPCHSPLAASHSGLEQASGGSRYLAGGVAGRGGRGRWGGDGAGHAGRPDATSAVADTHTSLVCPPSTPQDPPPRHLALLFLLLQPCCRYHFLHSYSFHA